MIQILDGFDTMDFTRVTEMLSKAYWCEGIGLDEVKKGAAHSEMVVGAFMDGEQIGYARTVSDLTRFAYIMDVYVDDRYRRMGIGQMMVRHIRGHEDFKDIYQWLLATRDAHGVYEKCGFEPLTEPGRWMQVRSPRPAR
jgi:GNAT superfamily N-acetyltransferase